MTTPNPTDQRENLRTCYDKYAQERDSGSIQDWKAQERAGFLVILQQEHKHTLLEIGAGPGRDSLFFLEQGLKPVCIDLSAAMVELCQQKGLPAQVMDMLYLQFPDASFDAVYAMNSLLHLPKVEFPLVLQEISRVLQPGGLFYLGIYGGYEHEGIWDQDAYQPQRFFSFFSDEHLEEEVKTVFEILSFKHITVEAGNHLGFQSLTLRKHADTPQ